MNLKYLAKHRGNDVSMFERFLKQYLAIGVGDSVISLNSVQSNKKDESFLILFSFSFNFTVKIGTKACKKLSCFAVNCRFLQQAILRFRVDCHIVARG